MLLIAHFLISIIIAFALEIKFKRKYLSILLLGILGTLPDLDHLIPYGQDTGLFHNLIILGELPMALLVLSYILEGERNPRSSTYQRFFTCFAVIMYGHLILDIISGREIGFGLSSNTFHMESLPVMELANIGIVIGTTDFAWAILAIIVLSGNLIQKKLYRLTEEYFNNAEAKSQVHLEELVSAPIVSKAIS